MLNKKLIDLINISIKSNSFINWFNICTRDYMSTNQIKIKKKKILFK